MDKKDLQFLSYLSDKLKQGCLTLVETQELIEEYISEKGEFDG